MWGDSFFAPGGGYQNPADDALPYLENNPEMIGKYMDPYIWRGEEAYANMQQPLNQMTSNPTDYYNQIYQSYVPSDYYKYQQDQQLKAAGNSAAAGGFAGTESDIENQMGISNALLSQDWNNYLGQVLGIQNTGLQNQMGLYNTGFGASNAGMNANMQNTMNQAQIAYNGTAGENAYNVKTGNSLMNNLSKTAGMAAMFI